MSKEKAMTNESNKLVEFTQLYARLMNQMLFSRNTSIIYDTHLI